MSILGALRVGISLGDPVALCRVRERIRQEGGQTVALPRDAILHATASGGISALVYDMEPGDPIAVGLIRRIHAARPDCPIWLYYAPRLAVIERVAEVTWLGGVGATPQLSSPLHDAEIRAHVRHMLAFVPQVCLLHVLDSVMRSLPAEVRRFLEFRLECSDQGGAQHVKNRGPMVLARSELRHLERVCHNATLPGPMRLLDHLILALVTFKSFAFEIPLPGAVQQAGLSPKAFRRLRFGVFGADAQWVELEPRAQFDFALTAFAKACNIPRHAAEEIVEQVTRERVT